MKQITPSDIDLPHCKVDCVAVPFICSETPMIAATLGIRQSVWPISIINMILYKVLPALNMVDQSNPWIQFVIT